MDENRKIILFVEKLINVGACKCFPFVSFLRISAMSDDI